MHGADHEMGGRAGTENVVEIAGLGKAAELIQRNLSSYREHMRQMRDRLERGLSQRIPDLWIHGHPEMRLPNTSCVGFRGLAANTLLSHLDNVAASAGAACHSDQVEISSVLEAMRVPLEYAMGTLRFSVGRFTTAEEIDRALDEITRTVSSPAAGEISKYLLVGSSQAVPRQT